MLGVLLQVIIGALGNTFKLSPTPWKFKLNVASASRIMRKFIFGVLANPQHVGRDAQVDIPLHARLAPVVVPLRTFAWRNEEFELHLFELARAKNKVTGGNFISETFTHLSNSKWRLLATRLQDVGEIDEHTLRSFWAKINSRTLTLDRAGMRLEHQIKSACICKGATFFRLRTIPIIELILSKSALADRAVDKRIAEVAQVSTGFKNLGCPENRCINQYDVVALLNHRANPRIFNVAQHQRTKRAVVIRRTETTVDFAARIDESATLTKVDDLV